MEIVEFKELVSVIEDSDVCRLAINTDGTPYLLPLNFGMSVEGDEVTLYFHGAFEGKKYDLISKDPHVSFEVDCSHELVVDEEKGMCTMLYRSVIGEGVIEDVPESERKAPLEAILAHYGRDNIPVTDDMLPMTRVMKLIVRRMTGKARRG